MRPVDNESTELIPTIDYGDDLTDQSHDFDNDRFDRHDHHQSAAGSTNEQIAQLDLANAYINMGEDSEARKILEGLADSDDPSIRRQVEDLLRKIL